MTNDQLRHPSARDGYYVAVSGFGGHGVYNPNGALVAVFHDLDAACRRARWLNTYKPKVAKK